MAILLNANGTITDYPCDETTGLTLEQMQTAVGGYIEIVRIPTADEPKRIMIVNENGLAQGLQPNPEATKLYIGDRKFPTGVEIIPIVGNVLIATMENPGTGRERIY